MNGVILISVLSVGNSAIFGSSRSLAALADQGHAPRVFAYIDRRGRPLVAICFAAAIGLLAYLADYKDNGQVFDWLLAISGLAAIFTWASTCVAHIRLRGVWLRRNRSLEDLAFQAQGGIWGSWAGLICTGFVLVAQIWVAISPLRPAGAPPMTHGEVAQNFFVNCLALPVLVVCYVGHKLWFRTSVVSVDDMDIDTGRRDFDRLGAIRAHEQAERQAWPKWRKFYKLLC